MPVPPEVPHTAIFQRRHASAHAPPPPRTLPVPAFPRTVLPLPATHVGGNRSSAMEAGLSCVRTYGFVYIIVRRRRDSLKVPPEDAHPELSPLCDGGEPLHAWSAYCRKCGGT